MGNGSNLEVQQGADLVCKQPNESCAMSEVTNTTCKMTPCEYKQVMQEMNNACPADLPQVDLDPPKSVSEVRGPYTVSINDKGEVDSITDNKRGTVMTRDADGKWTFTAEDGTQDKGFENVTVDYDGTLSFDKDGVHKVRRADDTITSESKDGTRTVADNQNNIIEASAGEGHTRKFHYDGQHHLDQIDGRLGHWERSQDSQGRSVWTNKDTHAVWKGEFEVMPNGDLTFQTRNGTLWTFDAKGKDIGQSTMANASNG